MTSETSREGDRCVLWCPYHAGTGTTHVPLAYHSEVMVQTTTTRLMLGLNPASDFVQSALANGMPHVRRFAR